MIEDIELREIYKTSSEEHLQQIQAALLELEKHPQETAILEKLSREIHSLKGDSRIVGLESVESLTHAIEDILVGIKRQEKAFTTEVGDRLNQALDAIASLVSEGVTGTPCNLDYKLILQTLTQEPSEEPINQETNIVFIEDSELREIYKVSSQEHLQLLQAGLLELEKQPENSEIIDRLMREVHSLKGDSRIIGIESVEAITHGMEDILGAIKRQEVKLTTELSDRLNQALDAITLLVKEALTGMPSGIDYKLALKQLKPELPEVVVITNNAATQEEVAQVNGNGTVGYQISNQAYHIDTIRVQTRHLDSLMTQTGELTVTKIRIAHFASEIEEFANLWEDWKSSKYQKRLVESSKESLNEDVLEKTIEHLRLAATENSTRLELIATELEEKIRTLRLLPLSTIFNLFPRMVRDLAKQEEKQVELIVEGADTAVDKQILEEIKDPLMHMIRNAIDHGIETPAERETLGKSPVAKIWLRGYQTATNIVIEVADDGRGLNIEKIKETAMRRGLYRPDELANMTVNQIQAIVLEPGFSTRNFITEVSGRGVGLDVVRTNIERLKGNIQIDSTQGKGCCFRIQLGTTLATANVLLVEVKGIVHALPLEFVETSLLVSKEQIFTIEGRQTIEIEGQAVSVIHLADLLELRQYSNLNNGHQVNNKSVPCILLNIGSQRLGLFVDDVLDTQMVVIKPQSKLLRRVRNVTGATILGTGEVCQILNPVDLLKSVQKANHTLIVATPKLEKVEHKPTVLLAEDSIATRTQEKRILENAGYEVVTAFDGLDGLNKLYSRHFDAVISDVQMPNLDGLSLTTKIRQHKEFNELPVILVTSLSSDEDKRKGAQAGANAYIVKDKFNQEVLIETLNRLVGAGANN